MTSKKGKPLADGVDEFTWAIGPETFTCKVLPTLCRFCGARAITALPPPILAKQPDDTTHVCHPGVGGCNQGFTIDDPMVQKIAATFAPVRA
jgi:hypothetical protein